MARIALEWSDLPACPGLARGEVHLVGSAMPEDYRPAGDDWALLTATETARAQRFRFDLHRSRWVYGRSRLKRLLARYLDRDPSEVSLEYGELGKPRLSGGGLVFNYSDSGGHLVYALSSEAEVGVDVEHLPRPTPYEGLARRKLTPVELAAFEALPQAGRELAFLACWTRKEAWGKALGVGIRYPMQSVTLCPDFSKPTGTLEKAGSSYQLVQFEPPFPGIACVVAELAEIRLVPWVYSE